MESIWVKQHLIGFQQFDDIELLLVGKSHAYSNQLNKNGERLEWVRRGTAGDYRNLRGIPENRSGLR